ncbi:alkane 1-monooxygenase [Arenimonas fontis]|uniref:Alkane 1-monooxygenase n=1 Tax=Arenimonas fontis TaxID=2608255 RepID=A0A5B2ZF86_9GAMM|nr:alkane 1-monooxygenase [Arenimonas fontis]KAA2285751.1 alkane 1-monooxygenase [Arenimonas fontis]
MPLRKALAFLLVFVVPVLMPASAWLAGATGHADFAAWFPLFFLFVLLPALDYALGRDPDNVPVADEARVAGAAWFKALTLACLPAQLAVLAWSAHWFVHADLGPAGIAGWLLSQGVVGGIIAINPAHELIHKNGRLEPAVGGLLLATVGYHGFKVEHLRGHHVHVSTPEDPSSAPLGMSSWRFVPRALLLNSWNAWRLEADRLRCRGLPVLHWRNEMIGWSLAWLALAGAFGAWLGQPGLAFFLAQGLIAAGSLEVINYVEHYGLARRRLPDGRYERTTHLHSWNSDYALSNWLLFQLQRHSDHHAFPKRRYPILRHHPDSPQLSGGYAAMFVLALLPPLWRRVMDPRARAFLQSPRAA